MRLLFAALRVSSEDSPESESSVRLLEELVSDLLPRHFPVLDFEAECNLSFWTSENGRTRVWEATNEDREIAPLRTTTGARFESMISNYGSSISEVLNTEGGFSPAKLSRAPGAFGAFVADGRSIRAASDACGHIPVFYCETPAFRLVSTRLSLLATIQRRLLDRGTIAWNAAQLQLFASTTHYWHGETCVKGIQCLGVHSLLTVTPALAQTQSWFSTERALQVGTAGYNELISSMTENLVDSCRPIFLHGSCNVGLTGGRDSRLVAAALSHWEPENVATGTTGIPSHPDVIIGTRIAELFGWKHKLSPFTPQGTAVASEPLAHARHILDCFDMTTSAWDEMGPYQPYSHGIQSTGVGGEVLRGGYASTAIFNAPDRLSATLGSVGRLSPATQVISGVREELDARAEYWRAVAMDDPATMLHRMYHEERNHRWVTRRRWGVNARTRGIDPMMDNRVVLAAMHVDPNVLWSERLMFDIVHSLAPQLLTIPVEGTRWRFEQNGPAEDSSAAVRDTWQARYAMVAEPAQAHYAAKWLRQPSYRDRVYATIREQVAQAPAGLLDLDVIEGMLVSEEQRWPNMVWNLLTMLVLINEQGEPPARSQSIESVAIPELESELAE